MAQKTQTFETRTIFRKDSHRWSNCSISSLRTPICTARSSSRTGTKGMDFMQLHELLMT